jgi:hypothetical protein
MADGYVPWREQACLLGCWYGAVPPVLRQLPCRAVPIRKHTQEEPGAIIAGLLLYAALGFGCWGHLLFCALGMLSALHAPHCKTRWDRRLRERLAKCTASSFCCYSDEDAMPICLPSERGSLLR